MNFWQAVILAVVEGLTEFLPVSSTAHLIIAASLLRLPNSSFLTHFEIIIQLGAIGAIALVFFKKLTKISTWSKIMPAFLITSFLGFITYHQVQKLLAGGEIILWALAGGGIVFIALEKNVKNRVWPKKKIAELSWTNSFFIGIIQCLAFVPGVSRSAATIAAGLISGLSRQEAAEFSFFLALPTLAAAAGLDLAKSNYSFSRQEVFLLATGLIFSFLTALAAVRGFLKLLSKTDFVPFGIYRILLAAFLRIFS